MTNFNDLIAYVFMALLMSYLFIAAFGGLFHLFDYTYKSKE